MKEMKNNAAPAAVAVPDEREAFEKWMSNDGQWPSAIEREADGGYKLMQAASHWNAWQARAALAATPAAEPFGYFKAEPFGWTDCGPDDEGAVALYEKPQALLATGGQALARSKNGWTFEELEAQLAEATKADPENCRAVGEELLKVIHDNFAALKAIGWDGPVDSPVEVVADLLNLLDEAKAAAPQQADARDAESDQ